MVRGRNVAGDARRDGRRRSTELDDGAWEPAPDPRAPSRRLPSPPGSPTPRASRSCRRPRGRSGWPSAADGRPAAVRVARRPRSRAHAGAAASSPGTCRMTMLTTSSAAGRRRVPRHRPLARHGGDGSLSGCSWWSPCSPWWCSTARSRSCRSGRPRGPTMPRRADAIVVLGAAQYNGRPSPALRDRLEHALALYRREHGAADRGHRRPATGRPLHRGDQPATSGCASGAVPDRRDPEGGARAAATWESLSAVARILRPKGADQTSCSYRARRTRRRIGQVSAEVGLHPTCRRRQGRPASSALLRETGAVSVGRLIGYRRSRTASTADTDTLNRPESVCRLAGSTAIVAARPFGGGVIGNTAGSGPVVGGSSPPPRATP